MENRIDLSKYDIRSDLLVENIDDNSNTNVNKISDSVSVTTFYVDDKISSNINRKVGTYITISFQDITNYEDRIIVSDVLTSELKKIISKLNLNDNSSCLIIGLGNSKSTADSLGPKVIDNTMVTRHLFLLNTNVKDGIRCVSCFSPSVMANTGIETFDIIEGIISKIHPDFLVVIDSLAALSIDRLNKTIQITDTGINPGSGIGNNRKEISIDTIGIPVIAIGVPTVLYSSVIVNDTINYLFKHISYIKNNYSMNKLVFNRNNYSKKLDNISLNDNEKEELSGIIGTLSEEEKMGLISEVLDNLNYNLVVTPKEIDFLINKISLVISNSINNSLHSSVNSNNLN
ncbi:MAG: GPR endopeptidase [Bacilli bacterium]|nr:GPR endopeptidase [Bacilli bacterium]